MTSGEFRSIPIADIVVDREGRQRRELTRIDELAKGISKRGLINPIVVTRDLNLVTGERRLAACTKLGWSHILCQYEDELDPRKRRAIELEENIKRVDLTWQDQCMAVGELHESYVEEHGVWSEKNPDGWTQEKTAEEIGLSPGMISQYINLHPDLERGDPEIATADKISSARRIRRVREQRQMAATSEAILSGHKPADGIEIVNADFLEWAPTHEGPRFNFIHCDFPHGIGADKFNQGSASIHGGYPDTFERYEGLIDCLINCRERLVSDSAHLMFWFSMDHYCYTYKRLTEDGWFIHPHPLIWFKNDNSGILSDPVRGPRRVYETAFFGYRGDRHIVEPVSNLFAAPLVSGRHMSEKNEDMLRYFFRMFVDSNTVMLDPTCGSGSALRAVKGIAKAAVGLEINKDFYDGALVALRGSE
jgi:ParB/RepB/Spo0J family partition protein